ncbi:class I SAM-dependent methyltransferase [Micromonospora sp. B11E3]|uniref:class I SAM-dependent methyltransferase n=1 Tax=Micromonospora sp. B11E3 TaxID=3153562 RepID=UPI00325CCE4A
MEIETGRGRTRLGYDAVAEEYHRRIGDELAGKPLDRALLAALVEQATGGQALGGQAGGGQAGGGPALGGQTADGPAAGGPVADLGCGPGHVTAWLAARGVRAVGVDLSPAMVALARREHPEAEFREGDLLRLPAADGEFAAAVALYSIIHLDGDELRPAFAEARRVLRPGGRLLVAFHLGAEVRRLTEWWGHRVEVDFRFFDAGTVAAALVDAGFTVEATLDRAPYPREAETRRAYLLACA